MRKLSHKDRLAGMQILFEKHPQQISTIIDTFCAVDAAHLALGNLCQFNATPPDTDIVDLNIVAERFMAVTADTPDQKFKIDVHVGIVAILIMRIVTFTRPL